MPAGFYVNYDPRGRRSRVHALYRRDPRCGWRPPAWYKLQLTKRDEIQCLHCLAIIRRSAEGKK